MKKKTVKNNPLEFVSNVIEIKPDKRYMFIIEYPSSLTPEQYARVREDFSAMKQSEGLTDSFGFVLTHGGKMSIVEMDKRKTPAKK